MTINNIEIYQTGLGIKSVNLHIGSQSVYHHDGILLTLESNGLMIEIRIPKDKSIELAHEILKLKT